LSITTNLFYYYLFRTEETINYKKNRWWFRQNPLYIKSNDATIKIFILPSNLSIERDRDREREVYWQSIDDWRSVSTTPCRMTPRARERERERERESLSRALPVKQVMKTLAVVDLKTQSLSPGDLMEDHEVHDMEDPCSLSISIFRCVLWINNTSLLLEVSEIPFTCFSCWLYRFVW
jgi:hypothetical protein